MARWYNDARNSLVGYFAAKSSARSFHLRRFGLGERLLIGFQLLLGLRLQDPMAAACWRSLGIARRLGGCTALCRGSRARGGACPDAWASDAIAAKSTSR